MANNTVNPDLVRFEMRMVQGQDPHQREQKKPGAFGRVLSGIGKTLGAIAMPLSFLFPPAALGAAGMYGLGQIGDGMQNRAYQKAYEKAQKNSMTQVSFPGLGVGGSPNNIRPAAGTFEAGDQQIMKVLDARSGAMSEMYEKL